MGSNKAGILACVYVAQHLLKIVEPSEPLVVDDLASSDLAYIQKLGWAERLADWVDVVSAIKLKSEQGGEP